MARFAALVKAHPGWAVFVVACLYAAAVTWPVPVHMWTMIYGLPGDSTGTVFGYWSWVHALQSGHSVFSNDSVGAPLGSGMEGNPYFVVQFVAHLLLTFVVGPVASYNLGILSSFPLTAVVTFWLGRELGFTRLGAAFAGLAFAFVPIHVEKAMGHEMQTHMEIFSAVLLFGVRWWKAGRRRDLVFMGLGGGLAIWSDPYMAYITAFMIAAFFAVSLATRRRPGEGFGRSLGVHAVAALAMLGVVALFLPAAVLMAHRPGTGSYAAAISSSVSDLHRTMAEIEVYSAHFHDYVLPWEENPWVPATVKALEQANLHGSNFTESSLFLGYTVMLLGLVGLVLGRRRLPIALGLGLIAVGYWFSLPPTIPLGPLTLHAPSYYLSSIAPVYRVYSRFGFLVLLGACLLAGLGFTAVQERLSGVRVRRWGWLAIIPFVTIALEFHNFPPTYTYAIFPAPAEYQWLLGQPRGIVAEYPMWPWGPIEEILNRNYSLYVMFHHHPVLNGAAVGGAAWNAYPTLERYDDPAVVARLRRLGIRYVLVHVDWYRRITADATPASVPGLEYVDTIDGTLLFRVSGVTGA
ncbi:MAG TPA: hypothetical protein VG245_07485 [Candidatus Dormibacteraeota bacterium]|jgi:hypothetical protein|nr:hypothetical protein [Candidatus Dormibacteraeota bacterium]